MALIRPELYRPDLRPEDLSVGQNSATSGAMRDRRRLPDRELRYPTGLMCAAIVAANVIPKPLARFPLANLSDLLLRRIEPSGPLPGF